MKLQLNPNAWSCLPTAFAMALDVPVELIIKKIGHDGSAEPHGEPGVKIGFHVQECIDVAEWFGEGVIPIEVYPMSQPSPDLPATPITFSEGNATRFLRRLKDRPGVICGKLSGRRLAGHAVAWDGSQIYDPRGYVYSLGDRDFSPQCFWMLAYDLYA